MPRTGDQSPAPQSRRFRRNGGVPGIAKPKNYQAISAVRKEASGEGQMLAFCEKCFTAPQFLLRSLAVVDIGVGPVPSDDLSRFIAQRAGTEQKPSILSIEAAHADFHIG